MSAMPPQRIESNQSMCRYDFAVFGYFGDILGDVFFPPQAGHAAIVESFAVFGAAVSRDPLCTREQGTGNRSIMTRSGRMETEIERTSPY